MSTVFAGAALLLAVVTSTVCVALLVQLRRLGRRAATLEARVAALVPAPPLPPDLAATFGSGRRRILAVEILNPIELATAKSPAAKLLGAMRPALLTKVVYDQAAKQVVDQLEHEGVLADVRVHAAR